MKKGSTNDERKSVRQGRNLVRLEGLVASASISRDGVLARRIEIPISGSREILDIECEKPEIFRVFRSLRIGQWVEVEGSVRKRFWRVGSGLASRSYIEVKSLTPGKTQTAPAPRKR